jgi:damage-control phosphatase, subfamily I
MKKISCMNHKNETNMKMHLDCIPCFFKQALQTARVVNADKTTQKSILDEIAGIIPSLSMDTSPPEIGKIIYGIVTKITKNNDPYKKIKDTSNKLALAAYPDLKKKVNNSQDELLMAVKLSIAGNIIDYGANIELDIKAELKKILAFEEEAIKQESKLIFDYEDFKLRLLATNKLLILGDNTGEIVFDKLLMEEIIKIKPDIKITYAVKERPIINDALVEDALYCGLDELANVISSGSDAPGTVLSLCSDSFKAVFNEADLIISKGQGNFEALSKVSSQSMFFLFMAKCPVIAEEVGCNLNDINLIYHSKK